MRGWATPAQLRDGTWTRPDVLDACDLLDALEEADEITRNRPPSK